MRCNNCGVEVTISRMSCHFCGNELGSYVEPLKSNYRPSTLTTILFFVPLAILLTRLFLSSLSNEIATNFLLHVFNVFLSISIGILWLSLIIEYRHQSYHRLRLSFIIVHFILSIFTSILQMVFHSILVSQGPSYFSLGQLYTINLTMRMLSGFSFLFLFIPLTIIFFKKPKLSSITILWFFQLTIPFVFITQLIINLIFRHNLETLLQFQQIMMVFSFIPALLYAIVGFIRLKEQQFIS